MPFTPLIVTAFGVIEKIIPSAPVAVIPSAPLNGQRVIGSAGGDTIGMINDAVSAPLAVMPFVPLAMMLSAPLAVMPVDF